MPDFVWIILLLLALLIGFFEWRIMRKRPDQRSDREQKFLAADRQVATRYRRFSLSVLPIVSGVFSLLVIALSIPFWFTDHRVLGISLTVLGAVGFIGMMLLWRFARSPRGKRWEERNQRAVAESDSKGQVRWFVSPRAGVLLGSFFAIVGAGLLIFSVVSRDGAGSGVVLPSILLAIGALAIVAALAQGRAESRGTSE